MELPASTLGQLVQCSAKKAIPQTKMPSHALLGFWLLLLVSQNVYSPRYRTNRLAAME
jgi:hypothetical protein